MVAQIEQEKNDFLHCHVLYVIQSENLSGKQLAGVYFNYALGLCLLIKTLGIKPKGETVALTQRGGYINLTRKSRQSWEKYWGKYMRTSRFQIVHNILKDVQYPIGKQAKSNYLVYSILVGLWYDRWIE